MSDFDDTICQLRDLGMSKVANILRDLERDNMMLMSNNLKHRERIAEMERERDEIQTKFEKLAKDGFDRQLRDQKELVALKAQSDRYQVAKSLWGTALEIEIDAAMEAKP